MNSSIKIPLITTHQCESENTVFDLSNPGFFFVEFEHEKLEFFCFSPKSHQRFESQISISVANPEIHLVFNRVRFNSGFFFFVEFEHGKLGIFGVV